MDAMDAMDAMEEGMEGMEGRKEWRNTLATSSSLVDDTKDPYG